MSDKVYPKHIKTGFFVNIKRIATFLLLLVYFGTPLIRWDRGDLLPHQAIMLDLNARKLYIFNIEIWSDEAYYLTGMLILGAMGLFFVTSIYGRVWCGYTCPHTVFVSIFRFFERLFQGDRNEQMKLDATYGGFDKTLKKLATHIAWLCVSFSFATGWVAYFCDSVTLYKDIFLRFNPGPNALLWLIGLTSSTYLFAGFIRDSVCTQICPYGRFQSAMIDESTKIVTYHDWRGEPRGKLTKSKGGDCIDCNKCVVVCPMGIDIRNGLQMACIGCGLCIDACDSVMSKIGRPLGLIAYDSTISTQVKRGRRAYLSKFLLGKKILFLSVFIFSTWYMINSLMNKDLLVISIERTRGALYTIMPDGNVRNSYVLKLSNRTHKKLLVELNQCCAAGIKITKQGHEQSNIIEIQGESLEQKFFVIAPQETNAEYINLNLDITEEDGLKYNITKPLLFVGPNKTTIPHPNNLNNGL